MLRFPPPSLATATSAPLTPARRARLRHLVLIRWLFVAVILLILVAALYLGRGG